MPITKSLLSLGRALTICTFVGHALWAQSSTTAGTGNRESTLPDPATVPYALKTTGFNEEVFFQALRKGEFQHIYVKPLDLTFREAYREFVRTYGKACRAELPANAVELTEQVCRKPNGVIRRDPITGNPRAENGGGCSDYVTRRTGIYADPSFAKNYYVSPEQAMAMYQRSVGMIGNPDDAISVAQTITAVTSDVHQLLEQNSCSSPDMKILGENFRRFANNEAPLQSIPRDLPDSPVYDAKKMTLADFQKVFDFSGSLREQAYQNATIYESIWSYKVLESGPCTVSVQESQGRRQPNDPEPRMSVSSYYINFTAGSIDLKSLQSKTPEQLRFDTVSHGFATERYFHFESDPAPATRVRNLVALLRSGVASCREK